MPVVEYTVEIKLPETSELLVSRTDNRPHLYDLVLEALQMVSNKQATITITQSNEKNSPTDAHSDNRRETNASDPDTRA